MSTLPVLAIQNSLPHRYPFLLVDRILEIIPEKTIVGIKNVTISEPFFQGHFPGDPVMPGVLIVEAMTQIACILEDHTHPRSAFEKYVLAAIDHIKFMRPVVPGDQLKMTANIQWRRASLFKYQVQASVDGQLVCIGEITGAKSSTKIRE